MNAIIPPAAAMVAGLSFFVSDAASQAKWGPGCNAELLTTEFALTKAPEIACTPDRKAFIDRVISEMKGNYGGTMVGGKSAHPHMDTPEFVAFFLREFATPGKDLSTYDYRFERLLSRVASELKSLEDPRLDWDLWRAFLLYEDRAFTSSEYEDGEMDGFKVMSTMESARELLWGYLAHNAPAIMKHGERRTWWVTQLTRDLESPGGRPQRRWFLIKLISATDKDREALEKIPMPEKVSRDTNPDRKVYLRQPHPLDPFLHLTDKTEAAPPFEQALWQIAEPLGLSLEIRGVKAADLPPTQIHTISLEMTKWATDESRVINQESWSKADKLNWEWSVRFFRPTGRRSSFSNASFPGDRSDGVYFFVFNKCLYVWPKARMDAAVIQMLHTAKLIDDAAWTGFQKRGFAPLPVTLRREANR